MCSIVSAPPRTVAISHTTTTAAYSLIGDPRPAAGMESVGFDVNLMQASGGLRVRPGLLWFATRADAPDSTPSSIGSYVSATGHHAFQQSLSGTTDKFFVAPILMYELSTDGQGNGLCQVRTTWKSSGRALGARDVVVNPFNDSTQEAYYPLTSWQPALGATRIMASIVAMNVNNGDVQTAVGIRTAVDPMAPGNFVALESFSTPGANDSERNTGALNIPAGANITTSNVFQLVLAVKKSSAGANNSRATFRVATALITS